MNGRVLTVSYPDHLHAQVRKQAKLPSEFVVHSLRHTYLTRLRLAGVEDFTIMRLAGHSSVTISQRYVHPTGYAAENQSVVANPDTIEGTYLVIRTTSRAD